MVRALCAVQMLMGWPQHVWDVLGGASGSRVTLPKHPRTAHCVLTRRYTQRMLFLFQKTRVKDAVE